MFPYWLLFSIFAGGALGSAPRPGYARLTPPLVICGVILALIVGLRWEVGGDWDTYRLVYDIIAQSDLDLAMEMTEPAYALVNWIAGAMGLGIWAVNLVCALLFAWGLMRFSGLQPNPWLAVVVAIPFLVIVVAMGYTRQGAAVGLAMLALVALTEGSIRRCIVLVLLAGTFHRSALVLVPVIGLSYTQNRVQSLLLTLAASAGAYFLLLDSEIDRYSVGYVQQVYQAEGAGIRLAMSIVPALLILFFPSRFGLEATDRRLWTNFALLGLLLNLLYLVIESNVAIDRLGIYLIPMQMMVLSRLPAVLGRSAQPDRVALTGVILYAGAVQFVWLTFASNARSWVPYHFLPLVG